MTAWTFGIPLSPIRKATSLGTGTRVPPPPRGVEVSTPLNLVTVSNEILGGDGGSLRVGARVRSGDVAHEGRVQAEPDELVGRRTFRKRGCVEGGWLQRRVPARCSSDPGRHQSQYTRRSRGLPAASTHTPPHSRLPLGFRTGRAASRAGRTRPCLRGRPPDGGASRHLPTGWSRGRRR